MDFSLPNNLVASTTQIMSDMISGVDSYIFLVLGVILATIVIEILFSVLRK